uniref:ARAD1C28028p n=1 Tax=Blastobotrys adeninivorans TaxID=409370 RepID=A0A060T1Z7_BLAAD
MPFDKSPFAKALYESGTPKKQKAVAPNSPHTPLTNGSNSQSIKTASWSSPRTPTQKITGAPSTPGSADAGLRSSLSPGPSSLRPSSPSLPNAYKPTGSKEAPTGSWEHPSLRDIRRRTVNKELALRKAIINGSIIVAMYILSHLVPRNNSIVKSLIDDLSSVVSKLKLVWTAVMLICAVNVVLSLFKVIQPPERFDDLPLTPSQRKLLGLPQSPHASPTAAPSPPKYAKSSPQARVSPRPSPLSKSSSFSSSPLRPVGSPRIGSPRLDSARAQQTQQAQQAQDTPTKLPKLPIAPSSVNGTNNSSPNATLQSVASQASGGNSSSTYSPSGRFMYLAESPNNRRSSLGRRF